MYHFINELLKTLESDIQWLQNRDFSALSFIKTRKENVYENIIGLHLTYLVKFINAFKVTRIERKLYTKQTRVKHVGPQTVLNFG